MSVANEQAQRAVSRANGVLYNAGAKRRVSAATRSESEATIQLAPNQFPKGPPNQNPKGGFQPKGAKGQYKELCSTH
jgi:hypothetical protein